MPVFTLAVAATGWGGGDASTAVPEGFAVTVVTESLRTPMQMVFLDDDRALIVERHGPVLIALVNEPGFPTETYISLKDVHDKDETGVLSAALDPEWDAGQKWVYVYWGRKFRKQSAQRS